MYEAPNHTMPNQIALKRIMWIQTMANIAKSSCDISALMIYYASWSSNSLLKFRINLSVPSSRIKKSKRTDHNWS